MKRARAALDRLGPRRADPDGERRRERVALAFVAAAALAYAVLALYLTRDSVPTLDSLSWLTDAVAAPTPGELAAPHNGHLIALTRGLYSLVLRVFGAEPVAIEMIGIVSVAATACLAFVLLRRRIDVLPAAAGSCLILFLGCSPVLLDPTVAVFAQSTALGLGAIVALERRTLSGDVAACLLLLVGVAAFTVGLAFIAGCAVLVAVRRTLRDAWIVVVPVAAYVAWWAWAQPSGDGTVEASAANLLLIPSFVADSLAAGLAALAGLGLDLNATAGPGEIAVGWGRIMAIAFLLLLAYRARRGELTQPLVVYLVTALAYWTMGALVSDDEGRGPLIDRYAFPSAVLCLLMVGELIRPVRVSRRVIVGTLLVLAVALPPNLAQLRFEGQEIRARSEIAKADLGVAELARADIDPGLRVSAGLVAPVTAGEYLSMAAEYGTLGFSPDELPVQSPPIRHQADESLVRALALAPAPTEQRLRGCARLPVEGDEIELPPGGAALSLPRGGELWLRRFGDEFVAPLPLPPGAAALEIPTDALADPWLASVSTTGAAEVCPLAESGE
jgi:hypothetical protein